MFNLPAICDRCGTIFDSSIVADSGTTIIISSCKSGPCPKCGSIGTTPDGIYEIMDEVTAVLKTDNGKQIYKLMKILESVKSNDTLKDIEKRVDEEIPQYNGIIGVIRKICDKNKNVFAAAGIISSIIFGTLPFIQGGTSQESVEQHDKVIEEQRNIIKDYKDINQKLKENQNDKKNDKKKEDK